MDQPILQSPLLEYQNRKSSNQMKFGKYLFGITESEMQTPHTGTENSVETKGRRTIFHVHYFFSHVSKKKTMEMLY